MKTKLHFSPFPTNHASRTFFHSALMTAVILLLALGGAKLLPRSSSNAKQNTQIGGGKSCPSCATRSNQIIYAPLIDLPEAHGSEIVFNSRSPQEMDVTPTFYKLDGTAIVGKPVRIQSAEIRYVELKKLIPGRYRNDRDWGGMSLAYTGVVREMWAQLRLLGVNGGSNVDELFTVPQEVRSDLQEAVWWAPQQSMAIIALGNITDTATSAKVRFGNGQEQTVSLAPHATEIIRHAPLSQTRGQSVTINITGAAGSVIPTGLIASADGAFNSVIRFYETKMAKQPNLFGNGLRLAGTTPRMALKNTSSASITATPKFIPLGGVVVGEPVTLPSLDLAPQQTAEVDLGPLMDAAQRRADLDRVSVHVMNNGASGSLIGALYSNDKTTGVNYDVPLRDSGPVRNMTGAYPWKIGDDYTTIIYITNISAGPASFVAQINYEGSKYIIDPRKLAAGETAIFDMREMIAEQKPDNANRLLPKDALIGQFRWSVHGVTGGKTVLIGRAEMVSRSQQISTSYSCAENCIARNLATITPSFLLLDAFGEQYTMTVWEETCFWSGSCIGPYASSGTWSSSNTNIVSMEGDVCIAVGQGGAFLLATVGERSIYSWDGLDCRDQGTEPVSADSGVRVEVPTTVSIESLTFSPGSIQMMNGSVQASANVLADQFPVDGSNNKIPLYAKIRLSRTGTENASFNNTFPIDSEREALSDGAPKNVSFGSVSTTATNAFCGTVGFKATIIDVTDSGGTSYTGSNPYPRNVRIAPADGRVNNLNIQCPTPAPQITSLSRTSGPIGVSVTINGLNFGAQQGSGSIVSFNAVVANVTSWSSTSITTTVPPMASTGPVVVVVNGVQSNSIMFTVTAQ
jgi:IPT/TIG domain-containing protein